ncbi:5-formyltetrahydrofolate cyclo-ligase [Marivirga harenae]|mgnify:CR=1 FL=1|uniref:5-formyltetrahydrofolate cyclo-ligase n=1 Tax=Marivirga harenae TaxID=2010992 RepID=UPI0026DFA800|nr:5-formyltetrahydrofolate cyclo-ligase [Marivirga harenae]WKV12912.1 5-formyltetrahydrofolate cyclo-ligase [Marivirga harenae]|tara:strand:- start:58835 stop:59419 length:585 start_codon:yes stop_codon:yes gene_type:complete
MDKSTLRKVYLEKRKFLSQAEYERRNELLYHRLIKFLEDNHFNSIHTFIPIKKNKEPDVFPFVQYLWSEKPEVDVITGVSDLQNPIMHHVKITQSTTFLENKWGIPEPKDGESYLIDKIECVLVPMVVGSKGGHRIGYGKGYYDRFLEKCSPNTLFIGIALGPLLDGDLYKDQFDIGMHRMITPFEIRDLGKPI